MTTFFYALEWLFVGLLCLVGWIAFRSYQERKRERQERERLKRREDQQYQLQVEHQRAALDFGRAMTHSLGMAAYNQANYTARMGDRTVEAVYRFPPARVTMEQPAQPLQLPQPMVSQPTMDEVYSAVRFNALEVAFGRHSKTGEIVMQGIISGVHFKLVGASGFGKSCLAGSLLEQATRRNDPDHLRIALLDLEHKTSRLFESRPHVLTVSDGRRKIDLVATDADEVARHLRLLRKELDRRATSDVTMPLLLIYVEEMLSLQYEVDDKLKEQMLTDLAVLALRGRKYGMFLMACTQTDYSTKELKEAQKQFRTRSGFAVDPSAARAAGFVNNDLIKHNFQYAQPGRFLLEKPGFSELVLAPLYDVEVKLAELSNPSRLYVPTQSLVLPSDEDEDEATLEGTIEAAPVSPLHTAPQATLSDTEKRILKKVREGATISQIVQEIYSVKGGAIYTQRCREVMALIAQFIPSEEVQA